jgi:hypothetical protein
LPGGETQGKSNPPDWRELTRQLMKKIDTQALMAQQDYTMEAGLPLDTHFDCG